MAGFLFIIVTSLTGEWECRASHIVMPEVENRWTIKSARILVWILQDVKSPGDCHRQCSNIYIFCISVVLSCKKTLRVCRTESIRQHPPPPFSPIFWVFSPILAHSALGKTMEQQQVERRAQDW